MTITTITREDFLNDRQGRTFSDVVNDPQQPFAEALEFFNSPDRQRRMEESEIHHDRAPMAGVVRELESLPGINKYLGTDQARQNQRLRQAIGVLVRIIMESRGWKKTGKKGSLGVRSNRIAGTPNHNTGGLAFWFLRAERYVLDKGSSFPSVRKRCRELESTGSKSGSKTRSTGKVRGTNGALTNGSHKRDETRKRPRKTS